MNVLIVDDSKLARMAVTKLFVHLRPDWTRKEASNAEEALAVLQDFQPDLALLDFNMPGRDGLSLAAELRSLLPQATLAIVSANEQQEVVSGASAVGAEFLTKPINLADLEVLLERTFPTSQQATT